MISAFMDPFLYSFFVAVFPFAHFVDKWLLRCEMPPKASFTSGEWDSAPIVDNYKKASKHRILSWIFLGADAIILSMKLASPSDLYQVRRISLLGGLDLEYLVDLYEPLMGARALACYLTLSREKEGAFQKHDDLFLRLSLSSGEFYSALEALEAVGLVRTFTQDGKGCLGFVYCLYAPKTPGDFFSNALFAGTLEKTVGKERCVEISNRYKVSAIPNDYTEETTSFVSFFAPDFSDPSYQESLLSAGSRVSGRASTGFDRNLFLAALKKINSMYNQFSFSDDELKKIERLSALYSYSEETVADLVNEHYDFFAKKGRRFDYEGFAELCKKSMALPYLHERSPEKKSVVDGDGPLSKGIKKMESLSPAEYLTALQHGNKPASSDLDLLRELTVDMGLPSSVTNALVLYVLTKNKNILSKKLTEKIAASLVREGVSTALDALNYLNSTSPRGRSYPPAPKAPPVSKPNNQAAPEEKPAKEETMSDEDFQKMMKGLYDK